MPCPMVPGPTTPIVRISCIPDPSLDRDRTAGAERIDIRHSGQGTAGSKEVASLGELEPGLAPAELGGEGGPDPDQRSGCPGPDPDPGEELERAQNEQPDGRGAERARPSVEQPARHPLAQRIEDGNHPPDPQRPGAQAHA